MMKVCAVTSQFRDVFVTCYYKINLNILNLMLISCQNINQENTRWNRNLTKVSIHIFPKNENCEWRLFYIYRVTSYVYKHIPKILWTLSPANWSFHSQLTYIFQTAELRSVAHIHYKYCKYLIYKSFSHFTQHIWCYLWNSIWIFPKKPQYRRSSLGDSYEVHQLRHVNDYVFMFIGLCLKQLLDNHHTFSHYCLCTQKELCQSNTCWINKMTLHLIATILKALTILIKIKEHNIIFFNCSHAECKIP